MFDTKGNANYNMGNAQDIVISVTILIVTAMAILRILRILKVNFENTSQ